MSDTEDSIAIPSGVEYEAAKRAATRQVKTNPDIDTDAPGFANGFIWGFRAGWVSAS